jgi:acyl carrier protein
MRSSIALRLRDLFVSALNVQAPEPDADLIDGGHLDSLALVELLAALEQEFAIEIPLDEIELDRIRTLDRLTDLVAHRLSLEATDAA